MHPPPSPARTDFTLITEVTPESSGCNSVYSVVQSNHSLLGRSPPASQAGRRVGPALWPSASFGGHGRSMDFETKNGQAEV